MGHLNFVLTQYEVLRQTHNNKRLRKMFSDMNSTDCPRQTHSDATTGTCTQHLVGGGGGGILEDWLLSTKALASFLSKWTSSCEKHLQHAHCEFPAVFSVGHFLSHFLGSWQNRFRATDSHICVFTSPPSGWFQGNVHRSHLHIHTYKRHINSTVNPPSKCFWCPTSLGEIRARADTLHVWF